MNMHFKLLPILIFLLLGLVSCGGGSKDDSAKLTDIVISANTNIPVIGKDFILKSNAIYTDRSSKDVTSQTSWASSDTELATVEKDGTVKLLQAGTVVFSASYGNLKVEKEYTIHDKVRVDKIELSGVSQTLTTGDEEQLSVKITMTDETDSIDQFELVSFQSSDEEILTIDENGKINAVSHGNVTITVTSNDSEISSEINLTVSPVAVSINIQHPIYYVDISNTDKQVATVNATYSDESTDEVTTRVKWRYSTSNEEDSFVSKIDGLEINSSGEIIAKEILTFYIKPDLNGLHAEPAQVVVEEPLEILNLDDTNKIKVAWTEKTHASEYRLYWNNVGDITTGDEGVNEESFTDTNTFTLNDIDTRKAYYFRVAFKRDGDEEFSPLSPEVKIQPLKGQWAHKPALTGLRDGAAAVFFNEELFIFGGNRLDAEGALLTSNITSVFDIDTNGTWKTGTPMPVARTGMAACRHNERIYLFGGNNADGSLSDQILKYLPVPNKWDSAEIAKLPKALSYLSCNTVGDKIYLIGGRDETGAVSDVYIFDPLTEQTPPQQITASLDTARYQHASAVINNIIYVAGGTDGSTALNLVESLDTASSDAIWQDQPALKVTRAGLALIAVNDILYALGGHQSPDTASAVVEKFNPSESNARWTENTSMSYANTEFSYALKDSIIYIYGGRNNAIEASNDLASAMHLDTILNSWHPTPNPYLPVTEFSSVVDRDQLILVGGKISQDNPTTEVQAFDIQKNLWSVTSNEVRRPKSIDGLRSGITVTMYKSNIYAIGGEEPGVEAVVTKKVERYDPGQNTWIAASELNKARKHACSAVANNQLFVFGGASPDTISNRQVIEKAYEVYSPVSGTWISPGTWPNPRIGATCVSLNGLIYIIGGIIQEGDFNIATNKVQVFNPKTLQFRSAPANMIDARIQPAAAVLNGNIYIFGGFSGTFVTRTPLTTAERFLPQSNIAAFETNSWSKISDLPAGFSHLEAHSYGDKILLIGSKVQDFEAGLIENAILFYE